MGERGTAGMEQVERDTITAAPLRHLSDSLYMVEDSCNVYVITRGLGLAHALSS